MKRETLFEVVLLRVLGVLLIVFGHSTIIYSGEWWRVAIIDSALFKLLYKTVVTFHVPLFVFISGYVYNYTSSYGNTEYSLYLISKKKFKRLIIPYFVVAIFWLIPIRLMINFYNHNSFYTVFFKDVLLSYDPGSLWFILMLFNVFLLFYLIQKYILKSSKYYIYIFIICLFLNIISEKMPLIFQIRSTCFYLIYFYIGYVFYDKRSFLSIISKEKWQLYPICFLFYFISIALIKLFRLINIDYFVLIKIFKITSALSAILLLYSISIYTISTYKKIYKSKIIVFLNHYSYSIYLLHAPIIYIITFSLYNSNIHPFVLVNICFSCILFSEQDD